MGDSGDDSSPATPPITHARVIVTTTSASAPRMVSLSKAVTKAPIVSDPATADLSTTADIATLAHHPIIRASAIVTTTSANARKTVKGLKVATINPAARVMTGGTKMTNGCRTTVSGDDSSPAPPPIMHARAIVTTISASANRTVKGSKAATINPVARVMTGGTKMTNGCRTMVSGDDSSPAPPPITHARAIVTTTSANARKTGRGLEVAASRPQSTSRKCWKY